MKYWRPLCLFLLVAVIGSAESPTSPASPAPSVETPASLTQLKRVFVDPFTGGQSAAHMRELVIASLENSKLFILTENEERADAILRGAAEDLIFTDLHQTQDDISIRLSGARGRAASSGSSRTARDTDSSGVSVTQHDSSRIQERKHEAFATVRLVLRNGDVIWSTTQESTGAKFRGASADVADKIMKQLVLDMARAKRQPPAPPPAPSQTAAAVRSK